MNVLANHINELKASEAFTKQAKVFDRVYGANEIVQYKRERVRDHIHTYLEPGSSMLELNCGTGEDALFFAQNGFTVHATDVSKGMLEIVQQKIKNFSYSGKISTEQCSFTGLDFLKNKGPFDYVFSNFGGLNCTGELDRVLHSINLLVKPGGVVTLVIISKFCLWEMLLLFKGKFKTAFRRFFSGKGRKARVEGNFFKCWYYSASFIKRHLQKEFDLITIEGLCTIVPPSYIEHFAEKYSSQFSFLKTKENRLKDRWPWKYLGDYFVISFRKKTN